MVYVYPVVFSIESEGGYCVYAPDFSGCVTACEALAEGLEKIRDGIGGMLYIMERDKLDFPRPSSIAEIEHEKDDIVTLVDVDLSAYKRKVGVKAVRRTISIPEWMDEMATTNGVSLSQITQDALRQHFDITNEKEAGE